MGEIVYCVGDMAGFNEGGASWSQQNRLIFCLPRCCLQIFCDITYTLTSCTENEAHRYGRFLASALDTIMRWHSSTSIYEKVRHLIHAGLCTLLRN